MLHGLFAFADGIVLYCRRTVRRHAWRCSRRHGVHSAQVIGQRVAVQCPAGAVSAARRL